jgi:hypothetical protein
MVEELRVLIIEKKYRFRSSYVRRDDVGAIASTDYVNASEWAQGKTD